MAPGAAAQGFTAAFTVDPTDAIKNQVITSDPLNPDGGAVQVQVTSLYEESTQGLTVTLEFVTGAGFAGTVNISGNVETTNADGVATFNNLKIADPNEATFTDYQFEAVVSEPILTVGAAFAAEAPFSEPFDIWDAGCNGGESGCSINLRGGNDAYSVSGDISLTASDLTGSGLTLNCPGQTLIFSSHIFSHATLGENGSVFLLSHITRQEMKTASNNGQAHVNWCIGLTSNVKWLHNGARFSLQDTNGTAPGGNLFVGTAPKCPKKNAASFAPCIVSQMSDGVGGNITRGWLPGGDPPRRT
jgi:hypothetical protein